MADRPGYFDDDSVIRQVLRERALALSGPRALLMQAAHPLAVAGLLAHSDALEDPYVRLRRTVQVSRSGASNATSCGGGLVRFQNVYIVRRYRSLPWLCS